LDNSNDLFENKLDFYKENKTNKIDAYQIDITTSDEVDKFEDIITTKLGKTDFYYKNAQFSFRSLLIRIPKNQKLSGLNSFQNPKRMER